MGTRVFGTGPTLFLAAHRRAARAVLGFAITLTSLRRNGGPFFFDANEFLFGNPMGLLAFAVLVVRYGHIKLPYPEDANRE